MKLAIFAFVMLGYGLAAHAEPVDAGATPAIDAPTELAPSAPIPPSPPASTPLDKVDNDPLGAVKDIVESAQKGNWKMVLALLLAFVMLGLNKLRGRVRFFSGDRGGAILLLLVSLIGGVSTTLALDGDFQWSLLLSALGTALMAAGVYNLTKRIIWPEDQGKTPPAWLGGKKDEPAKAPEV